MTERVYYTDSRLVEFTARVVEVAGERVYLDRTAFYPTSGGQLFDTGTLGDARVVDVVDEKERIAHILEKPARFSAGDELKARVDWTRRYDHMQQHTGQHLLSAVFEELFGHKTVSVHFGDESSTLDLDAPSLSKERALKAERRANEIVFENRPVSVKFEDSASATGLRKEVDRTGELRIVEIAGIDRSACGGTHVLGTGEIGPIVVRRIEKYKQSTRVEFICGWRALARARADFDALSTMAASFTAAIDEVPALVAAQAAHLKEAETDARKRGEELAKYQARERYDAATPDASGIRKISETASSMDPLRAMAQAIALLPKVIYTGSVASPPGIVFAASADSGVNAGELLKAALSANGGRGGGSPRVAQGTVPDAAALQRVTNTLAS
ncbi:MAG TPA: alanine--tRNA ligase-related protein [Gemmatimonadaceae bacterium]|jgi:alanyl-tRNA synthetase|nr:alanine--tRNA ligase-related protein [Gemmatimonadaceae bacterium]